MRNRPSRPRILVRHEFLIVREHDVDLSGSPTTQMLQETGTVRECGVPDCAGAVAACEVNFSSHDVDRGPDEPGFVGDLKHGPLRRHLLPSNQMVEQIYVVIDEPAITPFPACRGDRPELRNGVRLTRVDVWLFGGEECRAAYVSQTLRD